jgi:hypothetical protein
METMQPTSQRVRAAAESLVSAGGELTQFQYVVAAGLSAYGMTTEDALRSAIGCIKRRSRGSEQG